ncbi:MAG: ribosome small subunit-dependent GTPase A [Melioribacteraceae bacterium]|nr:ribosome small subunit-dependent GTPase A [Melioribacteraceae bacterium]
MLFYFKGGCIKGRIYKIESKDYYVSDAVDSLIRCSLRGRFQKEFALKKDKLYKVDLAAVGDYVEFEFNKDGTGVIEEIYPRKNHVSRKAPKIKGASTRGERLEQIIASNLDLLVVTSSVKNPKFNPKVIDRLIVTGESSNLDVAIVINKIDLGLAEDIIELADIYKEIGYKLIFTSKVNGEGIESLKELLNNKTSLIWGQSGVGKSSLLNILYPHLSLRTGDISYSTSKGIHTTVTSVVLPIDENTFVIDTPGIREIDPYGIREEDLGHYFKEFSEYINNCKFNTCTHNHEPGCAIVEAVQNGEIAIERYESYLAILQTIEEDMNF